MVSVFLFILGQPTRGTLGTPTIQMGMVTETMCMVLGAEMLAKMEVEMKVEMEVEMEVGMEMEEGVMIEEIVTMVTGVGNHFTTQHLGHPHHGPDNHKAADGSSCLPTQIQSDQTSNTTTNQL